MFKNTYDDKISITPTQAEEFLSHQYKGQRDLSQSVVDEYRRKMIDGTWLGSDIAIASLNGDTMLINGQHQSWAFLESGLKKLKGRLRKYKCETMADVALLYRQFDTNRVRSVATCVGMEAEGIGLEWPTKLLSVIASAAATLTHGQGAKITKDERCRLLGSYLKRGDFVVNMLAPDGKVLNEYKFLVKAPIVAEMIATWDKCHSAAEEFWGGVKDRDGLRKNDPRQKISEWLLQTSVRRGLGAQYRGSATPQEIRARIRSAWNGYRQGRTMANIPYHSGRGLAPLK